MTDLRHAESFRDLLVYQEVRQLQREIYSRSRTFPREESFSLTSQVLRSSRSVGANIAEAWAKRRYERHFASKLSDADGELHETQHWIETAVDCNYLDSKTASLLLAQCLEIGRLIGGMIAKADLFCGELPRTLHESCAEYLVSA